MKSGPGSNIQEDTLSTDVRTSQTPGESSSIPPEFENTNEFRDVDPGVHPCCFVDRPDHGGPSHRTLLTRSGTSGRSVCPALRIRTRNKTRVLRVQTCTNPCYSTTPCELEGSTPSKEGPFGSLGRYTCSLTRPERGPEVLRLHDESDSKHTHTHTHTLKGRTLRTLQLFS